MYALIIFILLIPTDPKAPRLYKVIEGQKLNQRPTCQATHSTLPRIRNNYIVSWQCKRRGTGGYLQLDKEFNIIGRWENSMGGIKFGYDFWYQPRHNVMVSSEWAAPNTFMPGLIWKR